MFCLSQSPQGPVNGRTCHPSLLKLPNNPNLLILTLTCSSPVFTIGLVLSFDRQRLVQRIRISTANEGNLEFGSFVVT